jgi:hypothetical protein
LRNCNVLMPIPGYGSGSFYFDEDPDAAGIYLLGYTCGRIS